MGRYFPVVEAMPERSNAWWISPVIPTIANCALAVLWIFSTVGGWGVAAFCGSGDQRNTTCAADVNTAVIISMPPALLAAAIAVLSWAIPGVRRRADRLDAFLIVAAAVWILAEGILFVGGYVAKP
jgi:uncharacterized BrkB/YihY/UPF0761 family membrane protein